MTLNERDPHRNFTHISQQQNALPGFFWVGFFSTVSPKKKLYEKQRNSKTFFYQPNFIIINRIMNIFLRWNSVTFLWHCRIYTACGNIVGYHILPVRLVFLFLFSCCCCFCWTNRMESISSIMNRSTQLRSCVTKQSAQYPTEFKWYCI